MNLKERFVLDSTVIGPLFAFFLVFLLVWATTDNFFTMSNMRNISLQVCIVALIAIGSTLVILVGGIDLSPGSSIALLTMVLALSIKHWNVPIELAIVLVVMLGAFLGAINGMLVTYIRIPSFIATLATMSIYKGIAFMFNEGSPIFSISPKLESLFYGNVFGIPLALIYIVAAFTMAHIFLKYSKTGREIYAVGGNPSAALLSGINAKKVQLVAFIIAGLMVGVASVLMASRLNSGSPNYGVGMEMSAIAATVVGGTSLSGGHGNVISTLFGALIIVVVQNGLNLNAVPTSIQNVIIGVIIVLAVALDMWREEIRMFFSKKSFK